MAVFYYLITMSVMRSPRLIQLRIFPAVAIETGLCSAERLCPTGPFRHGVSQYSHDRALGIFRVSDHCWNLLQETDMLIPFLEPRVFLLQYSIVLTSAWLQSL